MGLILAAMLMSIMVPSLTAVYAEGQDKQREKAEAFVAAAEGAKEEVDELMSTMGEVPPEVNTLYEDGVSNLTAAQEELGKEDPDYGLAISLAREAMSMFREVYGQLNTLLEGAEEETEVETEDEEEVEEPEVETAEEEGEEEEEGAEVETEDEPEESENPKTLMEAIERARDRIDRVNGTIEANKDYLTGYAEDELNDLLVNATKRLDDAETALGEGDVSAAAKNATYAHKLISQTFVILKKAAGALNSERIKGFLTVITKFYNRTARLVDRAVQQGLVASGEFDAELGDIETLIEDAAEETTLFEDAIAYLIEARIRLESIQKDILELRRG